MNKHITKIALACARVRMQMVNKGNVVLYLDKELVEKSKELGFNLSKTFENHLRHLMTKFSTSNSLNNLELSSKLRIVAGGEGFEPSTPNLGGTKIDGFEVDQYRAFLFSKYCKSYATALLNNAVKYYNCYENPSKLLALPNSNRLNILKAMVNLAKFLGTYEEYKARLKNYGIRWTSEDTAFNGFLSIFSKQHNTLPQYLRDIQPILTPNERLFVKFLSVTGLRKNEALTSFNMIIRLNSEGKLCEYYNEELSVLEHFKYKVFLRKTKNAYISFVSSSMINEICNSQPVTYNAIHCRFARRKIKLRLKELRSYHNSYLRKNGVISELVDILSGRVPKTVFCRHYLGEDIKALGNVVLAIQSHLEKTFIFLPKS